jgi:hypothetical protein
MRLSQYRMVFTFLVLLRGTKEADAKWYTLERNHPP